MWNNENNLKKKKKKKKKTRIHLLRSLVHAKTTLATNRILQFHPHLVAIVYNDLRSSSALLSDTKLSSSWRELLSSDSFSDRLPILAEFSVVERNLRFFLLLNVVTAGSVMDGGAVEPLLA